MVTLRSQKPFRTTILISVIIHGLIMAGPEGLPWYYAPLHAWRGGDYIKNCDLIEFTQKIRKAALLVYYRTTHKKADFDQILASLQKQLTEFETWILQREENALSAIKEKYGMSDEIWQKCLSDIERIKKSNKQAMLQSYPQVTHDQNVPADIREILITFLEQNNINPQSVAIVAADPQGGLVAQVKMPTFPPTKDSNNDLIYDAEYIPAQIIIFPRANNEPLSEKMSYCAHEVQHLVSQHSITEIVLIDYLKHYCAVDEEEFKQTAEYKKFSQIHEAQAEILAALKNPQIANHMQIMRKKEYYPQNLYEEHFYDISTIDMLWKIHERLNNL